MENNNHGINLKELLNYENNLKKDLTRLNLLFNNSVKYTNLLLVIIPIVVGILLSFLAFKYGIGKMQITLLFINMAPYFGILYFLSKLVDYYNTKRIEDNSFFSHITKINPILNSELESDGNINKSIVEKFDILLNANQKHVKMSTNHHNEFKNRFLTNKIINFPLLLFKLIKRNYKSSIMHMMRNYLRSERTLQSNTTWLYMYARGLFLNVGVMMSEIESIVGTYQNIEENRTSLFIDDTRRCQAWIIRVGIIGTFLGLFTSFLTTAYIIEGSDVNTMMEGLKASLQGYALAVFSSMVANILGIFYEVKYTRNFQSFNLTSWITKVQDVVSSYRTNTLVPDNLYAVINKRFDFLSKLLTKLEKYSFNLVSEMSIEFQERVKATLKSLALLQDALLKNDFISVISKTKYSLDELSLCIIDIDETIQIIISLYDELKSSKDNKNVLLIIPEVKSKLSELDIALNSFRDKLLNP
ncbi:hypothetical protein K9N50_02490 [bacterium]|nr:hypothetical protein [bacterium]